MRLRLQTPPIPCVVPPSTFDAFGWCASDWVDCELPAGGHDAPLTSDNPPGLLFVCHGEAGSFLPRELAHLHASGAGFTTELALAPYAIDDATDGLYERRVRPRDAFTMFARDRASLFWGLHDWAHFHNHGPFEDRANTELQCDVTALAWLVHNQAALGLGDAEVERFAQEALALSRERFGAVAFDAQWLKPERAHALLARAEPA